MKLIRKINPYFVLSFFLPFFIMGTAFALNEVYPFGKLQFLISDLSHQYYPFFSDFWHKLRDGSSLMWSWTSGGGINYIAQLAGYASPLNFLIVFFPHEWLREVMLVLLLVKLGLCGLCFSIMLRYFFKRCDITLPMFSLFYALCAFTLGYYYNIMWFETIALLPIVVMGTHALVRDKKWKLYTVALALSVFCCYHIALFTCIFTVIVFIAVCIIIKPDIKSFLQSLGLIALCTIVAVGLTAVLTIPTFLALQNTMAITDPFPDSLFNYVNYVDILGNFIAFTPPTILLGLPNVYCGLLSIILLGPYIRTGKIPLKEKVTCLAVLIFLIISCNQNVLNFIWHGFHYPVSLPYRFSFLISFMMVIIAYRAYTVIEEIDWRDLLAMLLSCVFFHVCAALGSQNPMYMISEIPASYSSGDIAVSVGLGIAYIIIFALRLFTKKRSADDKAETSNENDSDEKPILTKPVLVSFLLILVIVEFVMSSHLGISTRGSDARVRDVYPVRYNDIQTVLNMREPTMNDFYRTERVYGLTVNEPAIYGYDGISIFSSTANANVREFMHNIGLYSVSVVYAYSRTTPLVDAFLGIRYLVGIDSEVRENDIYVNVVDKHNSVMLLENNYYLPLGFMVDIALAGYRSISDDPIYNQNELFRKSTGLEGDLFYSAALVNAEEYGVDVTMIDDKNFSYIYIGDSTEGTLILDYEVTADSSLYVYTKTFETVDDEDVLLKSNFRDVAYYFLSDLKDAGFYEKGDIITINVHFSLDEYILSLKGNVNDTYTGRAVIYAVQMNHDLFEQGYEILSGDTLKLTEFSDTHVKGTVNASKDGLLYTSIPYEKGWRVYVNGIEREIILIDNAMAAVQLEAGEHTVEFRYFTNGLAAGIIVTGISLLMFVALVMIDKKRLWIFNNEV